MLCTGLINLLIDELTAIPIVNTKKRSVSAEQSATPSMSCHAALAFSYTRAWGVVVVNWNNVGAACGQT